MSISLDFLPGAEHSRVLLDGVPLSHVESARFYSVRSEKSKKSDEASGEYGEASASAAISEIGGRCEIIRGGTIYLSPDEDTTREIQLIYPAVKYILSGCRLIKREKLISAKDGIRDMLIFSFESERSEKDESRTAEI